MLHGGDCSIAAGSSVPTATELFHAARRSWPSGFIEGLRITTVERRIASVAGSFEASSW